jgi:hypothetical protein
MPELRTEDGRDFAVKAAALKAALAAAPGSPALGAALGEYLDFLRTRLREQLPPGVVAEVNAVLAEALPVADFLPVRGANNEVGVVAIDLSALYLGVRQYDMFEAGELPYYREWFAARKRPRQVPTAKFVLFEKDAPALAKADALAPAGKLPALEFMAVTLRRYGRTAAQAAEELHLALARRGSRGAEALRPRQLLNLQVLRQEEMEGQEAAAPRPAGDESAGRDRLFFGAVTPEHFAARLRLWAANDDLCREAFAHWGWLRPRTAVELLPPEVEALERLGDDHIYKRWRGGVAPDGLLQEAGETWAMLRQNGERDGTAEDRDGDHED